MDAAMETQFLQKWPALPLRTGALPYRSTPEGLEFLLVRRPGRTFWAIPKGRLIAGQTLWEAAATEAFEEGGVLGTIGSSPIASFRYEKAPRGFLRAAETVEVVLYPLKVDVEVGNWPEFYQRERRWFPQILAAARVAPGDIQDLLVSFDPASYSRQLESA